MNQVVKAPQQLSEEWFAGRIGMVTGSRYGAVLGLSPFAKAKDVMREMVREHLALSVSDHWSSFL
mgnify:CR=1 FL=1